MRRAIAKLSLPFPGPDKSPRMTLSIQRTSSQRRAQLVHVHTHLCSWPNFSLSLRPCPREHGAGPEYRPRYGIGCCRSTSTHAGMMGPSDRTACQSRDLDLTIDGHRLTVTLLTMWWWPLRIQDSSLPLILLLPALLRLELSSLTPNDTLSSSVSSQPFKIQGASPRLSLS